MKNIVLDVKIDNYKISKDNFIRIKCNNRKNSSESIEKIKDFVKNSIVDASSIMKCNFPNIDSDIFISYSRLDSGDVKRIAHKIGAKYGWSCFIDSDVWNYYEDVISEIDDLLNHGMCENNYIDVIRDNVDIMLATSLMNIMNNSKVILLFDTDKYKECEDNEEFTYSPWIYTELCCAKLIDINNLKDKPILKHINESVRFKYSLDNYSFDSITLSNFFNWLDEIEKNRYSLLSDESIELLYNRYEGSNFINR